MEKGIVILGLLAVTGLLLLMHSANSGADILFDGAWEDEISTHFRRFQTRFSRSYASLQELEHRRKVFGDNFRLIQSHNSDPTQTYTLEVNQFTDLTFEEFEAYYLNPDLDADDSGFAEAAVSQDTPSDVRKIDWREKGIVHNPKGQGRCGSCWAFAAVAAVEEAQALFGGEPVASLSEQELVDCGADYGNHGCRGGSPSRGLAYVLDKGINLAQKYPYKAKTGICNKELSGKGPVRIKGREAVAVGPDALVQRLQIQPTTAAFHVQHDFRFYKSGVYNPEKCGTSRNHAVNAVGFDLDAPTPNFLLKNSWGKRWGDGGFFRIAIRPGNGTCAITAKGGSWYPIMGGQ